MPAPAATLPRIQRLPANGRGRDFAVGDLHGCRALLDRLLAEAGFDPDKDRLFSVGDLIDRGPEPEACLSLLDEDWFFAVCGNHEMLLTDAVHQGDYRLWFAPENGGEWARGHLPKGHPDTWLRSVAGRLDALPHLIVVGEGSQRFHVLHAEIPGGITDGAIDGGFPTWAKREDLADYLVWSRRLMGRGWSHASELRPGLSPSYCGHTIHPSVIHADSHVCLDTGAFLTYRTPEAAHLGYGLTLIETPGGRMRRAAFQEELPAGLG